MIQRAGGDASAAFEGTVIVMCACCVYASTLPFRETIHAISNMSPSKYSHHSTPLHTTTHHYTPLQHTMTHRDTPAHHTHHIALRHNTHIFLTYHTHHIFNTITHPNIPPHTDQADSEYAREKMNKFKIGRVEEQARYSAEYDADSELR